MRLGPRMTLDEFESQHPQLALALRHYVGHVQIDGVYRDEDGRWQAHVAVPPDGAFEICHEARCMPHCLDRSDRPRVWVWADHKCCLPCAVDSSHRYREVHE